MKRDDEEEDSSLHAAVGEPTRAEATGEIDSRHRVKVTKWSNGALFV